MFVNLVGRIVVSFGNYNLSFGNPWFWVGVGTVLFLLWRWWGIKKLLSFSIIICGLMFLMFKSDVAIKNYLGEEGKEYAFLTKPFFIAVSAFIFLYYAFIRKDSNQ